MTFAGCSTSSATLPPPSSSEQRPPWPARRGRPATAELDGGRPDPRRRCADRARDPLVGSLIPSSNPIGGRSVPAEVARLAAPADIRWTGPGRPAMLDSRDHPPPRGPDRRRRRPLRHRARLRGGRRRRAGLHPGRRRGDVHLPRGRPGRRVPGGRRRRRYAPGLRRGLLRPRRARGHGRRLRRTRRSTTRSGTCCSTTPAPTPSPAVVRPPRRRGRPVDVDRGQLRPGRALRLRAAAPGPRRPSAASTRWASRSTRPTRPGNPQAPAGRHRRGRGGGRGAPPRRPTRSPTRPSRTTGTTSTHSYDHDMALVPEQLLRPDPVADRLGRRRPPRASASGTTTSPS